MPRPGSTVPSNIPTRHLYRHLLREISYLPPAFSTIVRNQARHQFHQHKDERSHLKQRLARARTSLRAIKLANHGSASHMLELIYKAFGRSGRRRRQLVSRFVVKSADPSASDSSSLEALLELASNVDKRALNESDEIPRDTGSKTAKKNHAWMDNWDKPKLLQFLKSQKTVQTDPGAAINWQGKPIRRIDEDIHVPDQATWGGKPSEVLVRAKQAAWWKRIANKIQPPLGKGEWELLEKLSNGAQEQPEWRIPSRRTPAQPLTDDADEAESDWHWEEYATQSTAFLEKASAARAKRYFGETTSSPFLGKPHRDTLSDRWFRRVYREVWQRTCYMEQDPNTLQYKFTWGAAPSKDKLPPPDERQQLLFEGVDAKGQRLGGEGEQPAKEP